MQKSYTTPTLTAQGEIVELTRFSSVGERMDASGHPDDKEWPVGSLGFAL